MSVLRWMIFFLLIVGIILLQIFLSKRERRWPGLLLPAIAFLYGLLYPLNLATFGTGGSIETFLLVVLVFLLGNIPTMLLLGIYFVCREKQRTKKQLDKMHVQDLN